MSTSHASGRESGRGRRIYAVGDVHGHASKLAAMHELIREDLERDPVPDPMLIHLGDYIDRGPDSAACLSILSDAPPLPGVRTVNLMGNHEWMLLTALDEPSDAAVLNWLGNGGGISLQSWGISLDTPPNRWAESIPPGHLAFLRGLAFTHVEPDFLFVHAGVRPGRRMEQQRQQDLVWIREPFLQWDGVMLPEAPDRVVVHGHTPFPEPVVRPNRIGIDTGAGAGGPLTCVVLGAGRPRFLQVRPGEVTLASAQPWH